jgi:hypothetical protein
MPPTATQARTSQASSFGMPYRSSCLPQIHAADTNDRNIMRPKLVMTKSPILKMSGYKWDSFWG